MVFIDGENLLLRFESMLKKGRVKTEGTIYSPGRYVWHPNLTSFFHDYVSRVTYYTAQAGDEVSLFELWRDLTQIKIRRRENE